MARGDIRGRFRCQRRRVCRNHHDECGVWWKLVYYRENAVARSRPCSSLQRSIAHVETFGKAALMSKETKSREESASAQYWVDLVISLAPSWQSTLCCCCHDGLLFGINDGPERKATHKGHHDMCSMSTCGCCEWCDLSIREPRQGGSQRR